jgi:hypothetical protein
MILPAGVPLAGMRKAPRSSDAQGNHGQGAPTTPRRMDDINRIIHSLEDTWHLGLQVRDVFSPSTKERSDAETVKDRIRYLYYSDQPTLHKKLASFHRQAPKTYLDGRLALLLELLPPPNPTRTPQPSMREAPTQTPSAVPPRTFTSKLCKFTNERKL